MFKIVYSRMLSSVVKAVFYAEFITCPWAIFAY